MSDRDEYQTRGSTRYQWDTAVYRGDGVNTTVVIPEGKTVVSVNPPYPYSTHPWHPDMVYFDRAIPNGYEVTITLRDSE